MKYTPRSMKSRFPEVQFKIKAKKSWDLRAQKDRGACPPRVFRLKVVKRGKVYEAEHYDQTFASFQELTVQAEKDGWNEIQMGAIKKILKKEAA